jgi:hypothetical protein
VQVQVQTTALVVLLMLMGPARALPTCPNKRPTTPSPAPSQQRERFE